jgi:hypothetical protein
VTGKQPESGRSWSRRPLVRFGPALEDVQLRLDLEEDDKREFASAEIQVSVVVKTTEHAA